MADLVSLLIEGAVAVGTIGLTVLTWYQLRPDRKDALARELADHVYVPMRKNAQAWQDPEALPFSSTWKELEENVPYLTMRVPSKLKESFYKGEGILGLISRYNRPVSDLIRSFSSTVGNNVKIHIMRGKDQLGEIYPINIWKSGKSLTPYVEHSMVRSYPLIEEWSLELWADVPVVGSPGSFQVQRLGGTKEVEGFIDKLFGFLGSKEEATLHQTEHKILAEVGVQAQEKIEKQLRKRVAPQSSSPAKEPGNPFG